MGSTEKSEIMEVYQFAVVGTLTMYTFIDFVIILTDSIFRLNPREGVHVRTNITSYSIRCPGNNDVESDKMADPTWAGVGILILIFPGIFLMTQSDGPLKDGIHLIRKFWSTKMLKYLVKLMFYGIGIIFYPIMLLVIQMIAIWQNDSEWFNVVMLLAGLQAIFNSFPHLGLELYMLLNGGDVKVLQILSIVSSFIFLITNAIRFDLIANTVRFKTLKQKIAYGFQILPQHLSCIIFRVMAFVLTFSFIRWFALLPTILYIMEIMILAGYIISPDWNIVYNIGLTNIGMTNIGFIRFLSDKTKFPEDLNNRMKKFVRLSSVVTFIHHTTVLVLLLILEKHASETGKQPNFCWQQIIIWNTERSQPPKQLSRTEVNEFSFYSVFNNVIAVGLVNLCLTLYASKDIEVLERSKITIQERSMSENPQIERVRSSTYDRDIFRLSEPENDRNGASISRSTGKDSETEDEGEQLDLV